MAIDIDSENADGVKPAPLSRPFPRVSISIAWIIGFFAMQITAAIIVLASTMMVHERSAEFIKNPSLMVSDMSIVAVPLAWGTLAAFVITLLALCVYLAQKNRFNLIHFNDWSQHSFVKTVGICVALIGGAFVLNALYGKYVMDGVDPQAAMRAFFEAIPDTTGNTILLFLMVAVLPAFVEEILFRGLLQNALKHKMSDHVAIVLAALIFGLAHVNYVSMSTGFYALFPTFMLGLAFGYIYHITRSLRVTIILHFLNNSAALLLVPFVVWLES